MLICKVIVAVLIALNSKLIETITQKDSRKILTRQDGAQAGQLHSSLNQSRQLLSDTHQIQAAQYSFSTNCTTRNAQYTCVTSDDCVPWMNCQDRKCECSKNVDNGSFNARLKCEEHTGALSVLGSYCMTYDDETGYIEVGACIENCMNIDKHAHDQVYHVNLYPNNGNITSLNKVMCEKRFNRDGRLCGKCLPGYSPQAYSFNITCVNCTDGNWNLWKYFLIAFVPLTCLYFFVLFFKINTTSSHLHGFVLFAQAIALPEFARLVVITLEYNLVIKQYYYLIKVGVSLYSFWNLDFFRIFDWGICLDMSPLSVRALDYTIAAYPFFLTILSYILIELHDKNCKIVVVMWKPFRCIFTLFRRNWDIRTSVIDAYATFYVLSSFKFLCITFDLLTPTYVYTVGESNKTRLAVYMDGSVDYFGPEHLPYAIPAILIAFFFVVLPILLLLVYPCRCFQHLMNRFRISSHILHTFMDSFQGCYKDGTEPGTRDCRYFAGLYLLFRILAFVMFSFTLGSLYFSLATVVILLMVILVANARPHKASVAHYNNINMTFLCLLAVFYAALITMNIASIKATYFTKGCYVLCIIVYLLPLFYMSCISIHWIFSRRRWGTTFINRVRAWRRGYNQLEEFLPDRLANPDLYPEQSMKAAVNIDFKSQN